MSLSLYHRFVADPDNFKQRLVTRDETWVYHYDSEMKQQSMQWMEIGQSKSGQVGWKGHVDAFLGFGRSGAHQLASTKDKSYRQISRQMFCAIYAFRYERNEEEN